MIDEKDLKQAQAVYSTLCEHLDEHKLKYDKKEDKFSVFFTLQGEDLPIDINITVDTERDIIILMSHMPFAVPEDRRASVGFAVSMINCKLVGGSFDYNHFDGDIIFRFTTSYRGSLIGKELFGFMIGCSFNTIDEYNDKLFMVTKIEMTLAQIAELLKD